MGANFIRGEDETDEEAHRTHCSGTAAGTTYDVARKANIFGVEALGSDGSGPNSGVLREVDWAVNNAMEEGHVDRAVFSMSLGGVLGQTTNDAIEQAVAESAFVSVAAGNDGENAEDSSAASTLAACIAGAMNVDDYWSNISNYSRFLDIFAPGEPRHASRTEMHHASTTCQNVLSSWFDSPKATRKYRRYFDGLRARCRTCCLPDLCRRTSLVTEVSSRMQELTTSDVLEDVGSDSPDLLAYNGNGA